MPSALDTPQGAAELAESLLPPLLLELAVLAEIARERTSRQSEYSSSSAGMLLRASRIFEAE